MVTLNDLLDRRVINLQGLAALLLQFLHPLVAYALNETHGFETDILERLRRTGELTLAVMEGDEEAAIQFSKLHAKLKFTLREPLGHWPAGTTFSAADPELMLWVYVTLVVIGLWVRRRLYGRRDVKHHAAYYELSKKVLAYRIGLTDDVVPQTLTQLYEYYWSMIGLLGKPIGDLADTPVGQHLTDLVLGMQGGRFGRRWLIEIVAAAPLPPSVRRVCGLKWNLFRWLAYQLGAVGMRWFPIN